MNWIRTTDRLPDDGAKCLIVGYENRVEVSAKFVVAAGNGRGWLESGGAFYEPHRVAYWIAIPPAPESLPPSQESWRKGPPPQDGRIAALVHGDELILRWDSQYSVWVDRRGKAQYGEMLITHWLPLPPNP